MEDEGVSSRRFILEMTRGGIGTGVHFRPLPLQPYWRDCHSLQPMDFPVAFEACEGVRCSGLL